MGKTEKVLPRIGLNEWGEIMAHISSHDSFIVCDAANTSNVAKKLEKAIEEKGLRCRIRTSHRVAGIAASLIPTGITQVAGVATAIGIVAHNLATYNPDYEIIKCPLKDCVEVMYQK